MYNYGCLSDALEFLSDNLRPNTGFVSGEVHGQRWQVAKLSVTDKLTINDLILLFSSRDGPLLRYMHVFRITQNVQEKFLSETLHVLISF